MVPVATGFHEPSARTLNGMGIVEPNERLTLFRPEHERVADAMRAFRRLWRHQRSTRTALRGEQELS
jgi:hypothetical protein